MVTDVVPSPPRFLPSIFIAHRVQQSHCSSIFHRVLLTRALAFSASQFVRKKKSPRFYTNMHSGGFELMKLTCTRLEDNLVRRRGDRQYITGIMCSCHSDVHRLYRIDRWHFSHTSRSCRMAIHCYAATAHHLTFPGRHPPSKEEPHKSPTIKPPPKKHRNQTPTCRLPGGALPVIILRSPCSKGLQQHPNADFADMSLNDSNGGRSKIPWPQQHNPHMLYYHQ